jgi:glycosyltransferase involved in cell wall biosynthesis
MYKSVNYCAVAYTFFEIDHRVRRYAEALVAPENRVDAIVLKRKGQTGTGYWKGINVYRVQGRTFNETGALSYLFRLVSFFFRASYRLIVNHMKYRYDVIHVHNVPDFLVSVALIPRLLGARVILDIHDIVPELYCQKFGVSFDSPVIKALLLVEKICVRFADHVIVANDIWRERIIHRDQVPTTKCTTVLNYPDMEVFSPAAPKESGGHLRIIYPGTISHHHGIDILIRALALVKKRVGEVKLDIYARSNHIPYSEHLTKLIEELDLRDDVAFRDPVLPEELPEIYALAEMGVVPKRGGIFAGEAFSTKIFDFMAAGLPIIASRTPIDEYYFDKSLIMFFDPEDHEGLAECIESLHRDPGRREEMVENGKRYCEENNWGVKKRTFLDIIRDLVSTEGRE